LSGELFVLDVVVFFYYHLLI